MEQAKQVVVKETKTIRIKSLKSKENKKLLKEIISKTKSW